MLNPQKRKEIDLRLDEIEAGLRSDDPPTRVMAAVGFVSLIDELEPAIRAGEFSNVDNFNLGSRALTLHDWIMAH